MRLSIQYVRSLELRLEELRNAADQADEEYRDEIARLRLTDEERMLIESAAADWNENAKRWRDNDGSVADESERNAATLRGLLERLA